MQATSVKLNKKPYYEKNTHVVDSPINVYFEDLLSMTMPEFENWVKEMRKEILHVWDTYDCPPRTGKSEDEMIEQFNRLEAFPVHEFLFTDELGTQKNDVIINKSRVGVEVDQFFPNMYKTRINYSDKDTGYSIYDLFAKDEFLPKMVKGAARHLRRDSMYKHALSAMRNKKQYAIVSADTGDAWIDMFFNHPEFFVGHDFFLEEVDKREGLNSGYFQLEQSEILHLSKEELLKWRPKLSYRHHSTFDIDNLGQEKLYAIRWYKKGQKVFPTGFSSFRIGYIQPAVNFPPLTAKLLYELFTEHCKNQERVVVYDPSSGWAGRILGAMAVSDDRQLHYVGTDPNVDNWRDPSGKSQYELVAEFYNTKTYRGSSIFSSTNTFEMFCLGSEVIGNDPGFRERYVGEVDMVFTSPPYFNREAYSENENQSYKKFGNYESWRDGFLKPTLTTCVEVLKPGGYLLWNIADLLVKGEYLPLEADSRRILEDLGMKFEMVMKMALEPMPGANRIGEDGLPKCKNFCKVAGKFYKYEPVFVFRKPTIEA